MVAARRRQPLLVEPPESYPANRVGKTPAATAADIATHEAAANPHPTYLTQAEGDALYSAVGAVNTANSPNANEFARFTDADTIEGRTVAETKADLSLDNVTNTSDANKPVSTAQQTALDLKANLASPTLTGTPAAPTATLGTSTTQIATTAFVQAEIDDLVGAAPGALDTLSELADALADDAAFSVTVTNALAAKQPLDAELTALAGLNATAGLVEQTGAAAFTKRLLGVANSTDVPTRADADARYEPITQYWRGMLLMGA